MFDTLIGAQRLPAARFHHADGFARVAEIRCAHGAREQDPIDAVVDGDPVRIGRGHLHRLQRLVLLCVADDHGLRAHAAQVPVLAVVGEDDVLADAAARHRHDFADAVRLLLHVDDAQFLLAERRDVGLGLVAVVEDVVRDEVARQRNVLHDLAEILGRRIDVDDRDALLARRGRHRGLERLQRLRRLGLVIDHREDLAEGDRRQQRERRGKARTAPEF